MYGGGQQHHYGGGGGGYGAPAPQPVALPDTLNVVSIIDQPPAQHSSYGISDAAAQGAYGAPPPPQQQQQLAPPPQAQPQWQVHHSPEGRPYYFNASTGQSSWEVPS